MRLAAPRGAVPLGALTSTLGIESLAMAGLIVIGLAVFWLLIAAKTAGVVSSWCAVREASGIVAVIAFVCVGVLPFMDEIIGSWQFRRLCTREAVVWVHPDAAKVVAARDASALKDRDGLIVPVREQVAEYVDAATGEPFLKVKAFHTPGGFIMRAGLNMGSSRSCWPDRWSEPYRKLNLDELLERGKT